LISASSLILEELRRKEVEELEIKREHLEVLMEIMKVVGDNFKLIQLFDGSGAADVLMIAFILAENKKITLFPEEYILVTEDSELRDVAMGYGVKVYNKEKLINLLS
jgi:rRNA-processing protein FCF1